jgi:hypothetical protein
MIPTSKPKSNPYPWGVVRQLPNMQRLVVARFHRRSDADEYLWVFRRLLPNAPYVIVFDLAEPETLQAAELARLERSK